MGFFMEALAAELPRTARRGALIASAGSHPHASPVGRRVLVYGVDNDSAVHGLDRARAVRVAGARTASAPLLATCC